MSGRVARLLPVLAVIVVSACAPVPSTRPVAQPGTVTSGGGAAPPTPRPAVVDSGPSTEAEAVLATIPEPLDSSERVPPPTPSDADTGADVPIPQETAPLGQGSGNDSLYAAPGTATPPADTARAAPPSAGASGPCFRVQVAAPNNAPEADAKRDAATSLLLAPFVIEKEGGLYKVRSRDCLEDGAATRLRDRALSNGFSGAFKIKVAK